MAKIFPPDQFSPGGCDTPAILKNLALASRQLAELKGVAASIPRQSILISTVVCRRPRTARLSRTS
jgi:hypothetical protein